MAGRRRAEYVQQWTSTSDKGKTDREGEETVAVAPAVRDMAHLYDILWVEVQRAQREGRGVLYLDGCTEERDRWIVDEQLRHILAGKPGCAVAALEALPDGYSVCLVRTDEGGRDWHRTVDAPVDRVLALRPC